MASNREEKRKPIEEDDEGDGCMVWNDVSGAILDPKKVRRARREETDFVHRVHLHTNVQDIEVYRQTGKA